MLLFMLLNTHRALSASCDFSHLTSQQSWGWGRGGGEGRGRGRGGGFEIGSRCIVPGQVLTLALYFSWPEIHKDLPAWDERSVALYVAEDYVSDTCTAGI